LLSLFIRCIYTGLLGGKHWVRKKNGWEIAQMTWPGLKPGTPTNNFQRIYNCDGWYISLPGSNYHGLWVVFILDFLAVKIHQKKKWMRMNMTWPGFELGIPTNTDIDNTLHKAGVIHFTTRSYYPSLDGVFILHFSRQKMNGIKNLTTSRMTWPRFELRIPTKCI
jgi:hypothetical protein